MKLNFNPLRALITVFVVAIFLGCGEEEKTAPVSEKPTKERKAIDLEKAALFKVGNEIISIPSPVQTAFLLKKSGSAYRSDMLNDPKKISNYSTRFQRSINLGVYGADLGYATIYDQTAEAMSFITSTKRLADELGVTSAFNPELMRRFEANMGIQDSLLTLMGDAYKASNQFFQNSEQEEVGALVLCGGWIEALHFATIVAQNDGHEMVKTRIAEQKGSLLNLIKLLEKNTEADEIAEFVAELIDLYYLFDEVESVYTWKEPTTDEDSKTTVVNSVTEASATEDQLSAIASKVESIRNHIIG